jgi:hypothetical protein
MLQVRSEPGESVIKKFTATPATARSQSLFHAKAQRKNKKARKNFILNNFAAY